MVKPTGPHVAVAAFLTGLVSYVFVIAPQLAHPAAAPQERPQGVAEAVNVPPAVAKQAESVIPKTFPPAGRKFIGVTTREGAFDFAPVDAFERATGHHPSMMMFNEGWVTGKFDRSSFDKIVRRGMLPMLSWEPWNYKDDSVKDATANAVQPAYRLSRITGGYFDDYLKAYALGVKSLNYEVAIRLAHEMNGTWYPWGVNGNGNATGDYVKMWKHVRGIFDAAGVKNVTWVWSPNIAYGTKTRLRTLYPGDQLVDWIGLSGYYGIAGVQNYRPPRRVFDATLRELRTFSHRPIVITETGATNVAGLRTRWIGEFFDYLPQHPEIIGFTWYEAVKETDWRIISTPDAAERFGREADAPMFDTPWERTMRPYTEPPVWGDTAKPAPTATLTAPPVDDDTPHTRPPPRRPPNPKAPTPTKPAPKPTTNAPTTTPPAPLPKPTTEPEEPPPPGEPDLPE